MPEGDYTIRIKEGVAKGKVYLSLQGFKVVLLSKKPKDSFWRVKKIDSKNLQFNIFHIDKNDLKTTNILSCSYDSRKCDVVIEDCGTGRE